MGSYVIMFLQCMTCCLFGLFLGLHPTFWRQIFWFPRSTLEKITETYDKQPIIKREFLQVNPLEMMDSSLISNGLNFPKGRLWLQRIELRTPGPVPGVPNTQVLTGAFIDRLKLSGIQFYPVLWKIQVCIEDVKPHSDRRGNLWKWRWDIRYVCRHFDRKDWSKTFRSRSAKSFLLMKRAFQRSSCQFTTKKSEASKCQPSNTISWESAIQIWGISCRALVFSNIG